jgi:3-hydroxyisobutyrate dehydrogenase
MPSIAFIGLGNMGAPMVGNLLKQGFKLRVYDIVPSAISRCVEWGAIAAVSAREAISGASIIFTMLQTGEQVREVCLGEEGIFNHCEPGVLYIDSSSIDVESTRLLHEQALEKNVAMIDAPVSGGVKGAENAALTIMVGGERRNFERALPLLQLLGKNIYYAGGAGKGQAAKICNNMLLGISMIAVSEAFTLAQELGLDAKTFFEISSHSSGECWAMTHYNPVPGILENVPANNNYQPGFSVSMMLKDLKLSQEAAHFVGIPTEMGAKATELYQRFADASFKDLDFSAIIKMIKS